MSASILIVEDEPAIRHMLRVTLESHGYSSVEAGDVSTADHMLNIVTPDLILLDWMLQGPSGVEFARRLKHDAKTSAIPIIVLTAKNEQGSVLETLDHDADAFITKPFSTRELLEQVRDVIRRCRADNDPDSLTAGPLKVELEAKRILHNGRKIDLSQTEFRLLDFFVRNPERAHSRTQLLDAVWGSSSYIDERTVDVHIRRLRKLLAPHGADVYVQTVRSIGYRFSTQVN